eukprot:12507520-Ditylum_brightwellii.AAC.1
MLRKREDIIEAHVSLLNYAAEQRRSYKQWQNIVNIAIAKLLGIDKVHLIQILHLYESDYLLFIGLIWKELVEEAEKRGTINCGLHGGHQGHDVKTLSFIEKLKYDISYSSYKSLINIDNNAASCYNRILPNISSLVARKKGMHRNVTFVHATTIEKAKYQLKTALGVSEGYYSHRKTFPMYGSRQGATNSPQT